MIIFRHHRGLLSDSMKTAREFESFKDLQNYIVQYMKPCMNLIPEDVVPCGEPINDERIGWEDSDYLCIRGYNEVTDREGFEKYFGGRYENPLCIGMFAAKYKNGGVHGIKIRISD